MLDIQATADGVLRLSGRLDASQVERAREALEGIAGPLTLDLEGLDYISSAGLGVVLEAYKRLRGKGHALRLIRVAPRVRNVFTYAGLDKILTLE